MTLFTTKKFCKTKYYISIDIEKKYIQMKFQKFLIQKMSGKFLDKFQIYSIKMKLT